LELREDIRLAESVTSFKFLLKNQILQIFYIICCVFIVFYCLLFPTLSLLYHGLDLLLLCLSKHFVKSVFKGAIQIKLLIY